MLSRLYYIFITFLFTVIYGYGYAYNPPDSSALNLQRQYEWMYQNPWKLKIELSKQLAKSYQLKKRPVWNGEYGYYNKFVEANDPVVELVVKQLSPLLQEGKNNLKWGKEQEIMCVVSWVQQLKYIPDSLTGRRDYVNYPAETLIDGFGDCEDKSILAAAVLRRLGHDVILILNETADKRSAHIAIGINLPGSKNGGYFTYNFKRYYYTELTFAGWKPGEIPENWQGKDAVLIPLGF